MCVFVFFFFSLYCSHRFHRFAVSDISVIFNDFLLAVYVCSSCLLLKMKYVDIIYNDHRVNVGVCMSFTLLFLLSCDMEKNYDKSCMGLS